MTVRITPFSADVHDAPRYRRGGIIPILGGQAADRIDLSSSGEHHTNDFTADTIVAINVTADCYIAIGAGVTADTTKSEPWAAGTTDFRFVRAGERVSTIS